MPSATAPSAAVSHNQRFSRDLPSPFLKNRARLRDALLVLTALAMTTGVPAQVRAGQVPASAPAAEGAPVARGARGAQRAASKKASARDAREQREVSAAAAASAKLPGRLRGKVGEMERTDQPDEAIRRYLERRLPRGQKDLPIERYFRAREHIRNMPQHSARTGRVLPSQTQMGQATGFPADAFGDPSASAADTSGILASWQSLGPGNVGGRTRALLVDPGSPDVMYAAGVAGGVWKSTNGGASWQALDDFMANIAVNSMAFDPSDSSILYAGTGEGFFNADGVRGAGIFKSTDAGATWSRLASTAGNANFNFVNDIVVSNVDPQHVYAATGTGVWRSLDGGASWTLSLSVPTVAGSTTGVRGAMDLVMRTDQATDYVFVAAGTAFSSGEPRSRIFRNVDAAGAGAWVEVYSEATMGRTSLAIAPSNQNVIYAMSASTESGTFNTGLLGVFRSTSAGDPGSWTTQVRNTSPNKQDRLLLSNPINAALVECGFGGANNFLNQGWYDNVIAVDPADENRVWAGGIDLFRSDNGGVNWGVASYWWFQANGTPPANGDPQLVHADNHVLVFHPSYNGTTNQTMFVGNDGGVYKTTNAVAGNVGYVNGTTPSGGTITSTSPICGNEYTAGGIYTVPSPVLWESLNNGYAVTQFYHGVSYPGGATYFGGTQDNGTNRGTDVAGANAWTRINGGDGGYVAVNPANTNVLYLETTGLSLRKSTNGGASFAAATTGISGDTFPFITVFRMDPNDPNRLWLGGRFMWRTDTSATSWTRTSATQQTGGAITAIAIAPGNSNVVIDGAASGQLRRTTTALTANAASVLNTTWLQSFTPRGNGNGTISWVEYDPSNTAIVWATISNFNGTANANGTAAGHVFRSADGGATWVLADGTQTPGNAAAIPDIPAHSVVVDPTNGQRVFVGTDLGVFVTLDGGGTWYKEVTGFANTVVESLSMENVGGTPMIYAFTHGRGAFRTAAAPSTTVSVTCPVSVTYTGSAIEPCSATVTGAGGFSQSLAVTYASNVNAGTATASARFDGDATHTPSEGSTTFTITRAPSVTTVVCGAGPFAFTGAAIEPCTATATGPGGFSAPVPVTYTDNVNAGTATATASFAGDANLEPSSGSATFTIGPAASLVTVLCSGATFIYTGSPITPCAAVVTGPLLNAPLPVAYANNVVPGIATATASYAGDANHLPSTGTATFRILPRDALVRYIGQTEWTTSGARSSTVQVILSASMQDPTGSALVNATVDFIDQNTGKLLAGGVKVSPVAGTGTGTANTGVTLSTGQYGAESYQVLVKLTGNYDNADQPVADKTATVVVSRPTSANEAIGAGTIESLVSAAGTLASDTGADVTYTAGVSYNKSGSNTQGRITITIPRSDGVITVRSNAIISMSRTTGTNPKKVTIYTKASIYRLLDDGTVETLDGNVTLRLDVADFSGGGPLNDEVGVTVLSTKTSELYYSNNWVLDSSNTWETATQKLKTGTMAVN
jgi:hypothetical protein